MPVPDAPQMLIHYNDRTHKVDGFIQQYQKDSNAHIVTVAHFLKDYNSNSKYILQKTSGSTGRPKIIKIDKKQIRASASATLKTLNIKKGDRALLSINPDFIGGKMMIARSLIGDLQLHLGPITGNPIKNINQDEVIDFFSFVPYQLEKIIEESPDAIDYMDKSKAIILGGAPVSEILAQKIKKYFKQTEVYSTYGMTETVSHVALQLLNSGKEESFKALDGIKFSVDHRNCLIIHAPQISGKEDLITNDVVELISSTRFKWLGRFDFVINSGGIKIHPEIIEKEINLVFSKLDIRNRFFVFGLPDEKFGETLNMMLEGEVQIEKLKEILEKNLKPYERPKKIFQLDKLIETPNGKINRVKTIESKFKS